MIEISLGAAFIAGILMFLAPCTLPIVPGYLAFIAGVKSSDATGLASRRALLTNSVAFTIGFSVIFILFGVIAGFAGSLIGVYGPIASQIGGMFVILFGLITLGVFKLKIFQSSATVSLPKWVTPGHVSSAFLIGVFFALGWTPCVGPILASILLLASTEATVGAGALLLLVFSIGLAIPFWLVAVLYAQSTKFIAKHSRVLRYINYVGGIFLIILGLLLLTNNFGLLVSYGYIVFDFLGWSALFDYL